MHIDHWMMFGTFAEQDHFAYPSKDAYRGVVINANMAAHASEGLAAFLLEKTANHTYIIDPLTHSFQHDPYYISGKDRELKSSIAAIAESYGSPVRETAGQRPITPADFKKGSVLEDFVTRCLTFQSSTLSQIMKESDAIKYLEATDQDLHPYALVAPYFFMTEATLDAWLEVAKRAADVARRTVKSSKLFISVVISRGVVADRDHRKKLVDAFNPIEADGFLIWVDDLNEHQASSWELTGLLELARALRKDGRREVINLHGGYFSVLAAGVLGKSAMSGVTHGPEFGEFRSVVPVGGGIPIARYYVPAIHSRIRYRDALRFFNRKGWLGSTKAFFQNVCDCSECKQTVGGDVGNFVKFGDSETKDVRRAGGVVRIDFPKTETKLRCLRHYLQRKFLEYRFAATASEKQIVDDLELGRTELEEVMGLDAVAHLALWKKTLLKS